MIEWKERQQNQNIVELDVTFLVSAFFKSISYLETSPIAIEVPLEFNNP